MEVMLTERQQQVAELLSQGLSMEEAGDRLGISQSAVKQHADALRRKLGVPKARLIGQAWRDRNGGEAA